MLARAVIALNALIFIAVIPYLEIGPTHVFNPDWPGHARLHEVWQLISNAAFALLALVLAFRSAAAALPLILSLILSGSFLLAHALQDAYGGTMRHSDGSELLIGGVNPAFGLLLVVSAMLALLLLRRALRSA